MKTIGFGSKYYTLWDVTSEDVFSTIQTANGDSHYKSGVNHKFVYIKNISTSLEKTMELFPELSIDETLRGKSRSFSTFEKVEYPANVASFGKYSGQTIELIASKDIEYLSWFVGETNNEQKLLIKALPEYIAYTDKKEQERLDFFKTANTLEVGTEYTETFLFDSNLRYDAGMVDDVEEIDVYTDVMIENLALRLFFKDFSIQDYKGNKYALPTIKGKGKRVKGKNVKVTFVVTSEPYKSSTGWGRDTKDVVKQRVQVINFEIVK